MRKKSKTLFLLLSLFVFIGSLELGAGIEADDTPSPRGEIFDLAVISPGSTIERTLADGRIDSITFLSMNPFKRYEMTILIEIIEVEPFFIEETRTRGIECHTLASAISDFGDMAQSNENWVEQKIPAGIEMLQREKDACTSSDPGDIQNKSIAADIINKSRKTLPVDQRLNRGEKLTIKLRRNDEVWTFVYKYPSGKWLIYYGLCLVSTKLWGYDHYFVSESEDPNLEGFLLIKEPEPKFLDLEYIPTVFFTWMPTHRMSKSISHGITGGLGTDMKSPTFYIGYGIVFNYNIGISLGVIFHKQYQLKPQYSEIDTDPKTVNSILSFDDLHRSVYRPNVSIGISFRFGSNPFAEME